MITNICKLFEVECVYLHNIKPTSLDDIKIQFKYWIDKKEYRFICTFILESHKNTDFVCYYSIMIDLFAEYALTKASKSKKIKDFIKSYNSFINPKIILISRLLNLFCEQNNILHQLSFNMSPEIKEIKEMNELEYLLSTFSMQKVVKKKRNFYMLVEDHEIETYKTIKYNDCSSYRVLENVSTYSIQNVEMLNLFQLNRLKYKNELTNMYHYKWIYHASFSPIWYERIKQYYGFVDYLNMNVCFKNDDCLEEFYNVYGYEPDEQTSETQNKNVGQINYDYDWFDFYGLYKNNGIIDITDDELDELNAEPLLY